MFTQDIGSKTSFLFNIFLPSSQCFYKKSYNNTRWWCWRCRHREQTPPARHGGYPSPSRARHSVERETRYPDTRSTPGSRSRSRGHSRDRNHGHRDNRGYSSERPGGGHRGYSRSGTSPSSTDNTGTEDTTETDSHTVETVDREGSEYHAGQPHPG